MYKFNKTMASKENHIVDRCMRTDSSWVIRLGPRVIRLGSQLEESFLTHLSTIRFSLIARLINYWRNLPPVGKTVIPESVRKDL